MPDTLTLYSFSDADRSGKVRWVAEELGLEIIEQGVEFGAHRRPPYTDHNPLGQVPTARFRGQTLIESTAICHSLAEAVEAPRLWIGPGAPGRDLYLRHLAIFGETLEGRLVDCAISRIGLLPPGVFDVHAPHLKRRLPVVAAALPAEGYLCGDDLTLADVLAGYCLRLAVQLGLMPAAACQPYLGRLVARPAAQRARIFAGLELDEDGGPRA
jgi:glutathione S-transferase